MRIAGGDNTYPTTLAFDDSGDLWYSDYFHATIGEFTVAQLAASGVGIAFDLHAGGLPLH